MAIQSKPLGAALGAEVLNLDLRKLGADEVEEVRALLHEFEVLVFRGQHLDDPEHLKLGLKFGEIGVFPAMKIFGQGSAKPMITTIADGPDSKPQADNWHTDVTWTEEPPNYAILRADVVPERGGDTLWASLTSAFEGLSPVMQEICRGLEVFHDCTTFLEAVREKIGPESFENLDFENRLRADNPGVAHPLVRTHPDTGREALYLAGGFMRHIVGMHPNESQALLKVLEDHLNDARYHMRWMWEVGDVCMWDERSTNHRSAGDYFPQERVVSRCEVGKSRPYYEPRA